MTVGKEEGEERKIKRNETNKKAKIPKQTQQRRSKHGPKRTREEKKIE